MNNKPIEPMSAENVEEFEVWIFESRDLVVSVIPLQSPSNVTTENYEVASSPFTTNDNDEESLGY